MKIHGAVYFIIGIFLIGFSYFITTLLKDNNIKKFTFFILVGVIFSLIGIFKMGVDFFQKSQLRKKMEKHNPNQQNLNMNYQENNHNNTQYASQQYNQPEHHHQMHNPTNSQYYPGHQANHPMHHQQHIQHPIHHSMHNQPMQRNPNLKYCARCGAPHRHFDKFCYKCGNRSFR